MFASKNQEIVFFEAALTYIEVTLYVSFLFFSKSFFTEEGLRLGFGEFLGVIRSRFSAKEILAYLNGAV